MELRNINLQHRFCTMNGFTMEELKNANMVSILGRLCPPNSVILSVTLRDNAASNQTKAFVKVRLLYACTLCNQTTGVP